MRQCRKPLESAIERRACERILNELGVFSIKLAKTQEAGYPDREFLVPGGRPVFIEFKRPGEVPTPKQLLIHERLRHAGYTVEVHTTVEGAYECVRRAVMEARALHDKGREAPAGKRSRRTLP